MNDNKDILEGLEKFRMQISIARERLRRGIGKHRTSVKSPDSWPKISEIPDGFIRQ